MHRGCSSVSLSVCPSVAKTRTKNSDFLKTKQFRAMAVNDDLWEVLYGLFKEPIIGFLKFKMAILKIVKSSYLNEQELSYRELIARQLRTQYVEGI